ncbi:hypothetical protein D3C85_1007040 [compost metagenome]
MDLNEKQEWLKKERDEFLKRERESLEACKKIWADERKSFKQYDINSFIAKSKNDDDLTVLMERISDWVVKSQGDEKKNTLYMELLKCVYRIHSYCFNIETSISQAGAMFLSSEDIRKNTLSSHSKEKLMYVTKINQLERDLENAKKQIEFHENNGKRK